MTTPIYSLPGSGDYRNELEEALARIKPVKKKRKATIIPLSKEHRERYLKAHLEWFKINNSVPYNDGHYLKPIIPKCYTANGLQQFIKNYVNWTGGRAKRVNVQGRKVEREVTEEVSGNKFTENYYIKAGNKGNADVPCTIKGRSVQIEVKIGSDRPSKVQLEEQAKERAAGGIYEFIKTPEGFFELYDYVMSL